MAASLLSETSDSSTSVQEERFERLMQEICLSSGVARTTARCRFVQIDEEIRTCVRRVYSAGSRITVEDWGVSSGITAAEWFAALRQDYPEILFTASDSILYLIEARRELAGDIYILEPDGTPIQYIRPPLVVSLVRLQNRLYPVNRAIQRRALREWREDLAAKLTIPEQWNELDREPETVIAPPFVLRRLPLISPEVLALRGNQFRLRRHSVFTPLAEPVDVIRTMNVLNRAYFSEVQLRDAARAIEESLKPGGIWIVGRTVAEDEPRHDVTVFRKMSDGWSLLLRLGGGSEVEEIIGTSVDWLTDVNFCEKQYAFSGNRITHASKSD